MSPENKDKSIKITLDDLANVSLPAPDAMIPASQATGGAKVYGSIAASDPQTPVVEEKGNFLLQGWFYLGVAGMLGALAGWAIAEPHFIDGGTGYSWGNFALLPFVQSEYPDYSGAAFGIIAFGAIALGRQPNGLAGLFFERIRPTRPSVRRSAPPVAAPTVPVASEVNASVAS